MEHFPPYPPGEDDDHDDLAALDFSAPDDTATSGLDAFDGYSPSGHADDEYGTSAYAFDEYTSSAGADDGEDDWAASDPLAQEPEDDEDDTPVFLVTNPPGTVSVTAYMDGRVDRIDLSPRVTNMTERDLANEILVIAGLAREKARSAQHVFISTIMNQLGQDPNETQEFVGRTMGLPSPEEAQNEEARVFSTRYASDHE